MDCRVQALALDQVATETVGDRQGIAIDSVPCAEVSLEVGGPGLVRFVHPGVWATWMSLTGSPSALWHKVVALEDVANRAASRPVVMRGLAV